MVACVCANIAQLTCTNPKDYTDTYNNGALAANNVAIAWHTDTNLYVLMPDVMLATETGRQTSTCTC